MISGNDGLWQKEGGIFSFGYFVRSVFVCKTLVFRFWCSLWFTDFPFFSIWFLVFMKNTNGFSVLISNMILGFSYLTYFIWVFVSPRSEQQLHTSTDLARCKCY